LKVNNNNFSTNSATRSFLDPTFKYTPDIKFWIPKSDVKVEEDKILIQVDLQGINVHDFSLSINNGGYITLTGIKKNQAGDQESRSIDVRGHFYRKFYFGSNIDIDNVVANFDDGKLSILVPKLKGSYNIARRINIQSKL